MHNDRILRVALDWAVDDIDPPRSFGGWNTGRVVHQTHESLFEDDFDEVPATWNAPTNVIPRLAVRCHTSADARTYTFRVREGVRFHDGTPLDAEAVVINYERMYRPGSPYFSPMAADFNRAGVGYIQSVQALDAMTVVFNLSEPFPEFLRYMTQEDAPGAQSLISPAAIRGLGPDGCADQAPGTGAFIFSRRFDTAGGSGVELKRNNDYWDQVPLIEGIQYLPFPDLEARVKALTDGQVDIAYSLEGANIEELITRGFKVTTFAPPYLWYLVFNLSDPMIADLRIRQAIALAVDREGLCSLLFPGAAVPARSTLPPGSPSHDPDVDERYPYDPEQARQLLADAGIDGELVLEVIGAHAGSAQLNPEAIYEKIAFDLAKIGVRLNVKLNPDWVAYCNQWREGGPTGVAFSEMSWGMSCDHWLSQILHGANQSPKGFNAGFFDEPEIDELLDRARRTLNPAERTALYQAADMQIMTKLPILPLFTSRRGMIAYSPRVKGLNIINQCWQDFRRVSLE